ncbi:hypothetical protein CPB85DRAFT_1303266 [Mucidula mucida]|nr:hypothetical protein CPB85DRAFT_1303266 [Mucidula mucida]
MTSNAQLAALLSESYKEIEELRRRTCPAQDELRACLTALDDIRGRLIRLLGDDDHNHNHSPTLKRPRTNSDESRSETSPPAAKKPMITIPRANTIPVVPVPGKTYPSQNELGQRICRTCGQPGRYKEGKCVEKWGPGPLGPGTVCDRCRKKIKRVERRATIKPVVPQLARNNLPQALLSPLQSRASTPTYSPEPLEDLLLKVQEPKEEKDELMSDPDIDDVKEEIVDDLLDAVEASEGR